MSRPRVRGLWWVYIPAGELPDCNYSSILFTSRFLSLFISQYSQEPDHPKRKCLCGHSYLAHYHVPQPDPHNPFPLRGPNRALDCGGFLSAAQMALAVAISESERQKTERMRTSRPRLLLHHDKVRTVGAKKRVLVVLRHGNKRSVDRNSGTLNTSWSSSAHETGEPDERDRGAGYTQPCKPIKGWFLVKMVGKQTGHETRIRGHEWPYEW